MPDALPSALRTLVGISDLTDDHIRTVLRRATALMRGAQLDRSPFTAGLVFLSPSLRTRVGFASGVARLGGTSIEVQGHRSTSSMTMGESSSDTLRAVSGMVDLVVARTPEQLDRPSLEKDVVAPLVNGGDGDGEHPTQALIDLFAVERFKGPVDGLRIGVCGDLGSRSARSFIRLLERFPPSELVLIAPASRSSIGFPLAPVLAERTSWRSSFDPDGIDVLSMVGLPEGEGALRLTSHQRGAFALDEERLSSLDRDAVVLSPMPVIDEIPEGARRDTRVRMLEQSDAGVFVRMAVVELVLGRLTVGD